MRKAYYNLLIMIIVIFSLVWLSVYYADNQSNKIMVMPVKGIINQYATQHMPAQGINVKQSMS